jgi:hypothetical protein
MALDPPGAAMQQIADWLEKLGMSEYAQRFAENRIDFSVLRDLTDQDLKDLGVVLGDRRKMLRAIGDAGRRGYSYRDQTHATRHRQAPSSHRDVLRLSRFNGTVGPHGP